MPQLEVAIVGRNNTKAAVTGQNELLVKINSVDPGLDLATEATLKQVKLNTDPQQRKAYVERVSTPWTSTEDIFSFSVANVGTGNGTVQTATIKPGEIVNFDASSLNNFFPIGSVVADGTGTELLITWIVQG
jgi:hypothetical protein